MTKTTHNLRIATVYLVFIGILVIIWLNLVNVQIIKHSFFKGLAKKQYEVSLTVPQPRALIVDRKGNPLALNKDSIAAFILPKQLEQPQEVATFLRDHFPQAHSRIQTMRHSFFNYIKRKLSSEDIALIQSAGLTDIRLLNEPSRFYPLRAAAPLVGITDIDNNGLLGIEWYYNKQLAGEPQQAYLQKDARSGHFYFQKETTHAGIAGKSVMLTIDGDLQFLVQEELLSTLERFKAKEGAVIIVDPESGDILSMVTAPTFDPNNTTQLDVEQTRNRVIADAYELGSVFKVFAALAALEEGVVAIDELIDCQNSTTAYIDGRRVNTVESSVRGVVPFMEVISVSNNIGIAHVAKRVGPSLYDYYTRLGFGKKTGIPLPGEHAGFVSRPSGWSKQSIISLSYGYEVSATLLQLARAFAIIAHDGCQVPLRLVIDDSSRPQQSAQRLFSHESIESVKNILENTALKGSARRAAIGGYRVMAKTGTANMLVDGTYDPDRNLYTCAGIVERGFYRRVIVTFVKQASQKNLYASLVVAPLFERVAEKMLIHEQMI